MEILRLGLVTAHAPNFLLSTACSRTPHNFVGFHDPSFVGLYEERSAIALQML